MRAMEHWIFITSPLSFKMDKCLSEFGFVDFRQRNKLAVNDIVYIYVSSPVQEIKYKMIVERINIPYEDTVDDSPFDVHIKPLEPLQYYSRLRLLQQTDAPELHLSYLRKHGLASNLQSNIKVSGELLDYIDSFFEE